MLGAGSKNKGFDNSFLQCDLRWKSLTVLGTGSKNKGVDNSFLQCDFRWKSLTVLGAGGKNKGVDNIFFTMFFQIQKNSLTVRGHTAKIKEIKKIS